MIDNQIDTVSVGIRKLDGLTASAPEKADCGLAVDVNHSYHVWDWGFLMVYDLFLQRTYIIRTMPFMR
jgi:hypothetical protein